MNGEWLEVPPQVWFAVFYFGLIGLGIYILDTWYKLQA